MINREDNPEYLNAFLDYSATLNKSPNSIKEYNYDLAIFLKFIKIQFHLTDEQDLKKISIKDISIDTIKKIKDTDIYAFSSFLLSKFNSKSATRARKISTIRIFFKYLNLKAPYEFRLSNNPAQYIETPKKDRRIPRHLSLDDSKKLLDTASNEDSRNHERDFTIITLFLNCGLRLSELVSINIKDIDFNEYTLNVIGKGNKERVIYLNEACMKAISEYLSVRPKNVKKQEDKDALFLSERNERIGRRTVQYVVKKELAKAGLDTTKYSTHKLRHTAATLMYQYAEVDIRTLQQLLGHESISTTEIYTHVNNDQVRDAVERNPLNTK